MGERVRDIAPSIYIRVPKRVRQSELVADALRDGSWARHVGTELSPEALDQYLLLWTCVSSITLDDDSQDSVTWTWESNGCFLTRSAYAARFSGRQVSPTAEFTWQSRAPLRCRFFSWLAIKDRCWTSVRLTRHGLPHQAACPMCDQHQESMQHLMLECSFANQIWLAVGRLANKEVVQHRYGESLEQWCLRQEDGSANRRAHRAKCLLVMWTIWKHRNDVVFNGATPSFQQAMQRMHEEGQ